MAHPPLPPEDDVPEPLEDEGAASPAPPSDPAPAWLADLRRSPHRTGFYQALGDHALVFADRGSDQLVVSFDNLSSARDPAVNRDPWGYGFVAKNGWSHLGVMAFSPIWFRDEALFAAMRGLAAQGFFQKFRGVTLIGTSMGGYGACAFSSLIPGCRVIAFSPQSTLKKDLVPWEKRFSSGRKADWSGEFADAAAQTHTAAQVWIVHDPHDTDDARQAARFVGDNVCHLRTRHGGHKTALVLRRVNILSTVVRDVVEGRMTSPKFYTLYRQARRMPWFLEAVCAQAAARGRTRLIARTVLFLRANGQGFAAHRLRQKYLSAPGADPVRASPPALSVGDNA